MSMRAMATITAAAAFAAAACRPAKGTTDSAAVRDTAAASLPSGSAGQGSQHAATDTAAAAAAHPEPNGNAKAPGATPTAKPASGPAARGAATGTQALPTPTVHAPAADTVPKPSNQAPAGATTPAFVVFRDSLASSDLDWLRGQGFTIVNVNQAAHAVSVRVPDGYHGNPKANPRILRFTIAMR